MTVIYRIALATFMGFALTVAIAFLEVEWTGRIGPSTLNALGITVPLPLSGRADEVIE